MERLAWRRWHYPNPCHGNQRLLHASVHSRLPYPRCPHRCGWTGAPTAAQVSFSAVDQRYHVPKDVRVLHHSLKEFLRTHGGYRIASVEQKGATLYYNLGVVTRQNVVEVQVIVPDVTSYRVMAQMVLKSFHTTEGSSRPRYGVPVGVVVPLPDMANEVFLFQQQLSR